MGKWIYLEMNTIFIKYLFHRKYSELISLFSSCNFTEWKKLFCASRILPIWTYGLHTCLSRVSFNPMIKNTQNLLKTCVAWNEFVSKNWKIPHKFWFTQELPHFCLFFSYAVCVPVPQDIASIIGTNLAYTYLA